MKKKNPASEHLGSFLREHIGNNLGMSLRQVANAANINPGYLSTILSDPAMPSPSPKKLGNLATVLGLSSVELLFRAGWLGPRSEEILANLSVTARLIPKIFADTAKFTARYFADLLHLSVYSSQELLFKSLTEYLLKKNNLIWQDIFGVDPNSANLYLLASSVISYSAGFYIVLAKKLAFDPDEYLFLLGKIPDEFLEPNNSNCVPQLIEKTRRYLEAMQKLELVRKYQHNEEGQEDEELAELGQMLTEKGEWYLYEYIRDTIRSQPMASEELGKRERKGPINISFEGDGSVAVIVKFLSISEFKNYSNDIANLGDKILKARTV